MKTKLDIGRHRNLLKKVKNIKINLINFNFLVINSAIKEELNSTFSSTGTYSQSQAQAQPQPQDHRIRKPSTPVYNSSSNLRQPYHLVMLNSDSPFAEATRSLYFGNLPLSCTIKDICDIVKGERGLESVRLLPSKSCAFVDFISRGGAERFVARVKRSRSRIQIGGNEIKLGWAKEKLMQATVGKAIENGATRNVYLSLPIQDSQDPLLIKFNDYLRDSVGSEKFSDYFRSLDNEITSLNDPLVSFLYGIFDEFGPLDMVKVVPSRRIAFIHMAQVTDAMRAVAELPTRNEFKGKRLSFGRDRCGERMAESESVSSSLTVNNINNNTNNNFEECASIDNNNITSSISNSTPLNPLAASHSLSRTIYLGACNSPEITIEDICDHIHTGQLQSVRINKERKCAFVTFISGEGAEAFLGRILQFGLVIRNCHLKPAFAKENNTNNNSNAVALPTTIINALRKGYTRNLYLGNVDFDILTESRLRTEMSRFGPLDRIQLLKDRGVAFVHFANLLDGGRAFEQVKGDLCYRNCRVGFGKDRCESLNQNYNCSITTINNNVNNNNSTPNSNNLNPYYLSNNYPPFYFHPMPMMYNPSNIIYHHPSSSSYHPLPLVPHPQRPDDPSTEPEKYKDIDKDKEGGDSVV